MLFIFAVGTCPPARIKSTPYFLKHSRGKIHLVHPHSPARVWRRCGREAINFGSVQDEPFQKFVCEFIGGVLTDEAAAEGAGEEEGRLLVHLQARLRKPRLDLVGLALLSDLPLCLVHRSPLYRFPKSAESENEEVVAAENGGQGQHRNGHLNGVRLNSDGADFGKGAGARAGAGSRAGVGNKFGERQRRW